jgi:hypothetical protein
MKIVLLRSRADTGLRKEKSKKKILIGTNTSSRDSKDKEISNPQETQGITRKNKQDSLKEFKENLKTKPFRQDSLSFRISLQ